MGIRRKAQDAKDGERWLEVDASMTGTLTFKDSVNLAINGRFEGNLDTRGSLAIGPQAQVKASIRGESIRVAGRVDGDIIASTRVEVAAGGRVSGKVMTPRLVVEDGATLDGTLEMTGGKAPATSMTVEELARYLEVDSGTVMQWVEGGRLPAERDGERWRFDRNRIEAWIAQEKIK